MSLSRRRFIQATAATFAASALPLQTQAAATPVALPIPPLLESCRGPRVRVYNGNDVKLIYNNHLTELVAMTVSGLQVP